MRLRWKLTLGLVVLAAIGAFLWLGSGNRAVRDLEATRRALRQEGFKLELSEFKLALSPELSARAALLGTTTRAALMNRARVIPRERFSMELLKPAGPDSAVVLWQGDQLTGRQAADGWQGLSEEARLNRPWLTATREAAVSGPIRFEPIGSQQPGALLPYLADLRNLQLTFGTQLLLALHTGDQAEAWTNLLASTCLVTSYEPEPIDISHLVHLACATLAYEVSWNALQFHGWTDSQLAELQRHWEGLELWKGLPDTAAYSRANMAALCQLERRGALNPGYSFTQALRSPGYAWAALSRSLQQLTYLRQGTYEDEKALLLYYRDREVELGRAVRAGTWSEMRQLPSVTNLAGPRLKGTPRVQSMLNMRRMSLLTQGQGQGLVGRTAETEARRRLLVTALALERYRSRHGAYPKTLAELVPDLLRTVPLDFMDGQPLRYRPTQDGRFVLYSVGLDCVDDGGRMRLPRIGRSTYGFPGSPGWQPGGASRQPGGDLVWPRPASAEEVAHLEQLEKAAAVARQARMEQDQAESWWAHTSRRQAQVERILATSPPALTKEPDYQGRRLSEVLQNEGTNKLKLSQLLTLQSVVTGNEPEVATFELPIKYDALTNLGSLELYVDPDPDEDSDAGCNVGHCECSRATNGNCRLSWYTIYESPGKHALLAGLELRESPNPEEGLTGPVRPVVVSNLCQFSPSSMFFQPGVGGTFRAKLAESNGSYMIEVRSPAGEHVRTLKGSTSEGLLEVNWDLTDDQGKACTNESYDTVFHLTFPDSGRSQTLRGP